MGIPMMEVHILPRVRLMIGSILPAAVAMAAAGVWALSVVVMSVFSMSRWKNTLRLKSRHIIAFVIKRD